MNAEMWKDVEFQLFELDKVVELKIDDYIIQLINKRVKNKLYTFIYVYGKLKLEWLTEDCDIRRRFMCPSKKCSAPKKELNKIRSKKQRQNVKEYYTYVKYSSCWSSFSRLKKHLTENNNEITILL